jgi:hypothetical protein
MNCLTMFLLKTNMFIFPNPQKAEIYGCSLAAGNPSRELLLKKQESYGLGHNDLGQRGLSNGTNNYA